MLKVLAIVPCPQVFGLQIMTLRFFERLRGKVDSYFLVTRWSDGEFSRRLDELSIPYAYSWLGMISRKLDRNNLDMTIACIAKFPRLYIDFIKLVRFYHPDVIYTAGHHEIILLWPVLLLLRVPVVLHVHNPLPTGLFYRSSFFFWKAAVNHYIGVSRSVGSSISNLGASPKRISVLYNGLDVSRFPYVERRSENFSVRFGWPQESVIVGMTGQMMEAKGQLDFLEAARLVSKEHPEVRFVIGGKQEQAYFRRLQEQVTKDSLSEIVAFSGWQDDMASFYAGIDVFVLPTREDIEGFGLVIAEAMATGLPVIATRSGGATEVVADGKTGILVERRMPSELAEALRSLLTSPDRRMSMGKAGRQRVETSFDLSKQAMQLQTLLETIATSYRN